MDRPRPVPPYLRLLVPSACRKASKITSCCEGSMPMPLSRTSKQMRSAPLRSTCSATLPCSVNFTALDSRLRSTCSSRWRSVNSEGGVSSAMATSSCRPLRCASGSNMEARPLASEATAVTSGHLQLAGLHLGDVEDVVDQVQQVVAGGVDGLRELDLLLGEVAVRVVGQQRPGSASCSGRAQLVRHVGQELGLVAARALQLGRALLQLHLHLAQLVALLLQAVRPGRPAARWSAPAPPAGSPGAPATPSAPGLLLELLVRGAQFLLLHLQFLVELLGLLQHVLQALAVARGFQRGAQDVAAIREQLAVARLRAAAAGRSPARRPAAPRVPPGPAAPSARCFPPASNSPSGSRPAPGPGSVAAAAWRIPPAVCGRRGRARRRPLPWPASPRWPRARSPAPPAGTARRPRCPGTATGIPGRHGRGRRRVLFAAQPFRQQRLAFAQPCLRLQDVGLALLFLQRRVVGAGQGHQVLAAAPGQGRPMTSMNITKAAPVADGIAVGRGRALGARGVRPGRTGRTPRGSRP